MIMIHVGNGEYRPWLPACVPCSNSNDLQGVYRPAHISEARRQIAERLERFLAANALGSMDKQAHFRGDNYIEPIYGAFGEKL